MPKPNQPSQKTPETNMPTPEQTTDAAAPSTALDLVSKDDYQNAVEDNARRTFTQQLLEARTPKPEPERVIPPIAPQIAEQTRLEMEAGAARVREAEGRETERKAIAELHKNDKWQKAGENTSVFRPGDYVPDPKKGQGHVGGNSARVA